MRGGSERERAQLQPLIVLGTEFAPTNRDKLAVNFLSLRVGRGVSLLRPCPLPGLVERKEGPVLNWTASPGLMD